MTKNAIITTNEVPGNAGETGSGFSKKRLWIAVIIPEIAIAPIMLVSRVLIGNHRFNHTRRRFGGESRLIKEVARSSPSR